MPENSETLQMEKSQPAPVSDAAKTESEDEGEFWPLSGVPCFNIVLTKSHVKPSCQMSLPIKIHRLLPSTVVPVVLSYCGKSWSMFYNGDRPSKRFDVNWRTFVNDNNLKDGDACVFELKECSDTLIAFRAQILRGDFPPELQERMSGETLDAPIVLDD